MCGRPAAASTAKIATAVSNSIDAIAGLTAHTPVRSPIMFAQRPPTAPMLRWERNRASDGPSARQIPQPRVTRLRTRRAFGEKMTRRWLYRTQRRRAPSGSLRLVAPAQVVGQDLAAVLVLVAVDAEVLPVAAIGRVVAVIAVLVMDGEQVQVRRVEFARALRTDPAMQRQRALAISAGALAAVSRASSHQRRGVDPGPP